MEFIEKNTIEGKRLINREKFNKLKQTLHKQNDSLRNSVNDTPIKLIPNTQTNSIEKF